MRIEPIYSDDPQAVDKLQDKLDRLQTQQKRMKALNAAWRKAGKPAADNVVGWGKVADTLGQDLWQLDRIRVNMARDCLDRAPYTYEITNNGGNMKRIKDRIVRLMEAEAKEAHDKLTPQGKAAAEGLVDAFFQSEEEKPTSGEVGEIDNSIVKRATVAGLEEEKPTEWFPPPNRG